MITEKRKRYSYILATILAISLTMLPIIITTNQYQYALAKTITSGTLTLDTDKPLAPQFNQALLKSKTTLSPAEYKSKVETLQSSIQNVTSRCDIMMKIFKSVGFYCDTQFALASVMCQSQVLKQDLLLCNDPFINEFVKDRNVTNIEDYARYALEHDPDFSSSNSTMPSK